MKRALLVIDVQAEIPIVMVQHSAPQPDSATFRRGSQEWELHPEVAERPYDVLIERKSFTGPSWSPSKFALATCSQQRNGSPKYAEKHRF